MEPTSIIATIGGLVKLGNKLMEKFPDYKQRVEKDFNKAVKQFEDYKTRPREQRVSSYLMKLKQEIENHLISAEKYIK